MGGLQNFENKLEQLISGAFARAFRSAVQPVEIAAALQRECDNNAQILSRDRRMVPNSFRVELAQTDLDRLAPYDTALADDLKGQVEDHADQQSYVFPARRRSPSRPPTTSPPGASGWSAERDAEAELVALLVAALAQELLGRHVGGRSHPGAGLGQRRQGVLAARIAQRRGSVVRVSPVSPARSSSPPPAWRAMPKSTTRGRVSLSRSTLSGLKSRCTSPAACAAASPSPGREEHVEDLAPRARLRLEPARASRRRRTPSPGRPGPRTRRRRAPRRRSGAGGAPAPAPRGAGGRAPCPSRPARVCSSLSATFRSSSGSYAS